jgi:hypothetical protein
LLLPSALLLAASTRRGRVAVSASTALVIGGLAAFATTVIAHRRRCAREAQIDERLEQSFPASDPASL